MTDNGFMVQSLEAYNERCEILASCSKYFSRYRSLNGQLTRFQAIFRHIEIWGNVNNLKTIKDKSLEFSLVLLTNEMNRRV